MTAVTGSTAPAAERVLRSFRRSGDQLVQDLVIDGRSYESVVTSTTTSTDSLSAWWHAYLEGARPRPLATTPRGSDIGAPLRVAELFCGPGGLALGFGQAAAELQLPWISSAAADTDSEAVAIYRQHNETRFTSTGSASMLVDYRVSGQGDQCRFLYEPEIVDDAWSNHVGSIDVLLAGPPCQGHSNLNNQTRRTDKRNELYLTVPAMAIASNARVVIIENVRAAVHDRKQVVQSAAHLLAESGYHIEQGVLNAAAVGWPQRRERFFLVARRDVEPVPFADLNEALSAAPRDLTWAIGDVSSIDDSFMTRQPEFSDENLRRIDWLFDNDEYDLPLSERPECHREGTTYNAVYGRLYPDRPAPTVTTGFMTPGRGRYIHPTERRVINPREAARIQGFPDTYDFRPDPPREPAKSQLAKWIGDGVPMPLGYLATLSALGPGWT